MKRILTLLFIFIATTNCMTAKEQGTLVLIETEFGNIKLRLYDETPLHRDNFIKLIKQGFYNDLLFHRVIKDFMIQGGDPTSKGANDGTSLGAGDVDYTIPAEFVYPHYFHKKGALAAARMGDDMNPQRASSGSQFYVVTGNVYTANELKDMEKQRFERLKQTIFNELQVLNKDTIKELYRTGEKETLAELRNNMIEEMQIEADERRAESLFTEEQKETYTTIGGTPHLDGQYTIFGEIVEGMDVVDKIQQVETGASDRPLKNLKMKIKLL